MDDVNLSSVSFTSKVERFQVIYSIKYLSTDEISHFSRPKISKSALLNPIWIDSFQFYSFSIFSVYLSLAIFSSFDKWTNITFLTYRNKQTSRVWVTRHEEKQFSRHFSSGENIFSNWKVDECEYFPVEFRSQLEVAFDTEMIFFSTSFSKIIVTGFFVIRK